MWRPKFLFPELEIPDFEPPAVPRNDAPAGDFQLKFEADDVEEEEWGDSAEVDDDIKKFDVDAKRNTKDDDNEDSKRRNSRTKSWANNSLNHRSSTTLSSGDTIRSEDSLHDIQEFDHTSDHGDLVGEIETGELKAALDSATPQNKIIWRPKFEIPEPPVAPDEDVDAPVGDFNLEFESSSDQEEWDSDEEEDIKFDDDDNDNKEDSKTQKFWSVSYLNQSSSSFSSGFTISLDDALDDIRELQEDDEECCGDLKTDGGVSTPEIKNNNNTNMMWRPKFLFTEVEIPDASALLNDDGPLGKIQVEPDLPPGESKEEEEEEERFQIRRH